VVAPSLGTALVLAPELPQVRRARYVATGAGAVDLPPITATADVEHPQTPRAPLLAEAVVVLARGLGTTILLVARHRYLYTADMSRGKKLTKAEKRRRKKIRDRDQDRDQGFENFVQDTTARFTCSTETAGDFASHCHERAGDLVVDLNLARVAHEIWHDKSQPSLVAALADLATEEKRHRDALTELARRFDVIADERSHHHLDPPDAYRPLIRERLLSEDPQPPA
jgi:hypothetical protein